MESEFKKRAIAFRDGIQAKLGSGQEGFVWETESGSAVKVFEREQNYNRELKCYHILREFSVTSIEGFNIPSLLGFDDNLLAIELTIVTAPYLLDFGKAYFEPPDYPEDAVQHAQEQAESDFGPHWPKVSLALYELRTMGIFYVDANLRNICCEGLALD